MEIPSFCPERRFPQGHAFVAIMECKRCQKIGCAKCARISVDSSVDAKRKGEENNAKS